MKKFLICLLSFLIAFGVSVAIAGVYIEDFEDEDIEESWAKCCDYEFITDSGGSSVLHMTRGIGGGGASEDIAWVGVESDDEYIYRIEADVSATSGITQEVGIYIRCFYTVSPLTGFMTQLKILPSGSFLARFWEDDQVVDDAPLGSANFNQSYHLSITYFDDYVRFGIDDNYFDLFGDRFNRPTAFQRMQGLVHGFAYGSVNVNVDYYADNIVIYTSTEETIYEVVDSVEEWIDEEDLEGTGRGASADGRLNAFDNMLNNAMLLFENGDIEGACDQLAAASRKCDGQSPPPDFVDGDAVTDLQEMLDTLMNDFGCE